jgi:hypothetical protein
MEEHFAGGGSQPRELSATASQAAQTEASRIAGGMKVEVKTRFHQGAQPY